MDDAKRDAWWREVLAWAERAAASLGADVESSDVLSVLFENSLPGVRSLQAFVPLPVIGSPDRPAAFDAAALDLCNTARARQGRVGRLAVCVGRLLVYVWAVVPEGGAAQVIWLHDGAVRADVARRDDGDGEPGGPQA